MKKIHLLTSLTIIFLNMNAQLNANTNLSAYAEERTKEFDQIDKKRKAQLDEIAVYLTAKVRKQEAIKLTFICTHNSRRSQFGQAWGKIAAEFYGIKNVETYSGGTEVTAANSRCMNALGRAGFLMAVENRKENPRYILKATAEDEGQVFFSKKYSDDFNPKSGYAAIMVCSSADEACPVVFGAEKRFAIPYVDPKISDGTPEEEATYDERCKQIAREIFYVMSKVNK